MFKMSRQSIKPLTAASLLALGLGLSGAASAEDGFYAGLSLGNAKAGLKDPQDDINVEDTDYGYKLFGGFKFTIVAVEAGYLDFGQIEENDNSVEVNGFSAFGRLNMGLGPVSLFAKAGGFAWDSNVKSAQESFENNGFDPAVGLGAEFTFGGLGVRAEYEYFDIDNFDNLTMMSVGATYWF